MLPLPTRHNLDLSLSLQYPVPSKPNTKKYWNWRQKDLQWSSADWSEVLVCTRKSPIQCISLQLTANPNGYILGSSSTAVPSAGNVISDLTVYTGSVKLSPPETKCATVLMGETSSAMICISSAPKPLSSCFDHPRSKTPCTSPQL